MFLKYLVANAAYVFVFGDGVIVLDGEPRFFESRERAVAAAKRKGMSVARNGEVTVD